MYTHALPAYMLVYVNVNLPVNADVYADVHGTDEYMHVLVDLALLS